MTRDEFLNCRKALAKTQKELSHLLGASLKAVHSYEQGWRSIPGYIERQLLFLVARKREARRGRLLCWEIKNCPEERKENCPAWEFRAGHLCWFINGTHCEGEVQRDWPNKMRICRRCQVLGRLVEEYLAGGGRQ